MLERCAWDQLIKLAEYYSVSVADKHLKDLIKVSLKLKSCEMGLFKVDPEEGFPSVSDPVSKEQLPSVPLMLPQTSGLAFEQQKERLVIQLKYEKSKYETEIKKQIEVEPIRQQTEKTKLDFS